MGATSMHENRLASDAGDAFDHALVERAVDGSKDALRELVQRHQPFVFNLALQMFGSRADAEDLTQEVLVKVITSLRSFRHGSSIRTWLYRITLNHFMNTRRRSRETLVEDFSSYFEAVAALPDEEPDARLGIGEDTIEELRLRCTSGMLLCLDREQRITFILGAIFAVPHEACAEMLEISAANFRVRLHRARQDLHRWMTQRCGLIDPANACRCRRKTAALVRRGLVDPARLQFNTEHLVRIEALTRRDARATMGHIERLVDDAFASSPFATGGAEIIEEILGDAAIRGFFSLDH